MGLDITAYEKVTKVSQEQELTYKEDAHVWINNDFSSHDELEEGVKYKREGKELKFRAGSYSGYGAWRRQLAKIIGQDINHIWENPHSYYPFVELINFSDCEGTIGPQTSAKLAKDFQEWDERAREFGKEENHPLPEWGFYVRYKKWREAFELAANTGAVCFH